MLLSVVSVDALLLCECGHDADRLLGFTRQSELPAALETLSLAITQNPLWQTMPHAVLAARPDAYPVLAVFGVFSPRDLNHLRELAGQLERAIQSFRYIDYAAAEQAVRRLALRLIERFGPEQITRFRFTAIPRGGLIVLSMLAYALDLSAEQIVGPGSVDSGRTLVVVDDCALSGLRFQQFLSRETCSELVFCPLFANGDLCRIIEQRESRVWACIAAEAMPDRAPYFQGADYQRWHQHWTEVMGSNGYWVGQLDYLAFAWGEPQSKIWNPDTAEVDTGWNVVPPSLCLNRRAVVRPDAAADPCGSPAARPRFQLLSHSGGFLRPAPRVLWAELDQAVAVARMPDAPSAAVPCFQLAGSAADMWRAILQSRTRDQACALLLRQYDADPAVLRRDLDSFVSELQKTGILSDR